MIKLYRTDSFNDDSLKNFRLAKARVAKGMSMRDLVRKLDIPFGTYSLIESAKRFPSLSVRKKIAKALERDVDYLFPKRFKEYCNSRERVSHDVFDNLKRVRFNFDYAEEIEDPKDHTELLGNKERDMKLEETLSKLNKKDNEVIRLRFGFKNYKCYTLEKSAKVLNVTKERIRQREFSAITNLRKAERLKQFADFL